MATSDAEKALSLWDADYPHPVFMAPDFSHALSDLAAIKGFYDNQSTGMGTSSWTLSDVVVDVLGEAAYVHCYVSIESESAGSGHRMSFRDNDTFIFRMVGTEWKMILYHEAVSRDAPIEARQLVMGG